MDPIMKHAHKSSSFARMFLLVFVVLLGLAADIAAEKKEKQGGAKSDTIAPAPMADDKPINPKQTNKQEKKKDGESQKSSSHKKD